MHRINFKNILVAGILLSAFLFQSCSSGNEKNNELIFKELNESLEKSAETIKKRNSDIYERFYEKLYTPSMHEKTQIWQPKALQIKSNTDSVSSFISYLKQMAIAGHYLNDEPKNLKVLYEKLKEYYSNTLNTDPMIHTMFEKSIFIAGKEFNSKDGSFESFRKLHFYSRGSSLNLAVLSEFENNIRIIESEIINFCFNQVGSTGGGSFTKTSAFVSLNSSQVSAGKPVEIYAAIGTINNSCSPNYIINGKKVVADENGVGTLKINTKGTNGKYKVPVIIDYTDPNGVKQRIEQEVEYTVVKE